MGICVSLVKWFLFHKQFKQYLNHRCSFHCVFLCFLPNLWVCGFSDGIKYSMIHLDIFLSLPGMLANIGRGMILGVLCGNSSLLFNEVPEIFMCIFYHNCDLPFLCPSWFLGSIQDFLTGEVNYFGLSVKCFRCFFCRWVEYLDPSSQYTTNEYSGPGLPLVQREWWGIARCGRSTVSSLRWFWCSSSSYFWVSSCCSTGLGLGSCHLDS